MRINLFNLVPRVLSPLSAPGPPHFENTQPHSSVRGDKIVTRLENTLVKAGSRCKIFQYISRNYLEDFYALVYEYVLCAFHSSLARVNVFNCREDIPNTWEYLMSHHPAFTYRLSNALPPSCPSERPGMRLEKTLVVTGH